MIIDARWAGLKMSKTAVLHGFSCTIIFRVLQRIVRKRKNPVSNGNHFLMREVEEEMPDLFKLIEKQQ